jgi:hypothetical protein
MAMSVAQCEHVPKARLAVPKLGAHAQELE